MNQDLDKIIAEYVEKGLAGDMDAINSIEDRVLRGKIKAALARAKRLQKAEPLMDEKPVEATSAVEDVSENPNQKFGKMIEDKFPGSLDAELNDSHIHLRQDNWREIAEWLKSEKNLLFDSLQCITGMDIGEDKLESRYNLHSMDHGHAIEIRIAVPVNGAKIPSIEQVWRIGDWFERETYDMVGITFEGHRDLRRMLLPEDWEGYPLRKDYDVQETYHGIAIPKVKEGWE